MNEADRMRLGSVIRQRRLQRRLSQRELARRAGLTDIVRIEKGLVAPKAETLRAIADGLQLNLSELLIAANFEQPAELPPLMPYLRSKYDDLDDAAVAEVNDFVERLRARHGGHGPIDREDER